jgi:long-chain acyl-CoA synthetase
MLYRLLCDKAENSPDKVAIAGERRAVTFRQLLDETTSVARFLQDDLKLKAEEPLVIGVPGSPEFFALCYAAAAIGATAIPVSPSGKVPARIKELGGAVAVGQRDFLRTVEAAGIALKGAIVWDRAKGLHIPERSTPLRRRRLVRKEMVFAAPSSGTTGEPTLSFRSAELLTHNRGISPTGHEVASDDVMLCTRLFSPSTGLWPLIRGGKLVVREKFGRFALAEAVTKERVTVLYSNPFFLDLLASIPADDPADFSSLRLCISGGAPLPRAVFDRFYQRFGIRILQVYAGTQISPAISYSRPGSVPEAAGHVSGRFPMAVVDEKGRVLKPGKVGEIVVEVNRVKEKFFRSFLRQNPHCRGRYLYSGDLGKVDTEGNLYVVGRKGHWIKVGGFRVAPAEVEDVLRSHPKVREAVVFPLNPGGLKELVGALVVPADEITREELFRHCAERLEWFKCPQKIEFRETLPRNAAGKVIPYLFSSSRRPPEGSGP